MPEALSRRPTPEQLLKQVEAEERNDKRGKLKIFLGYASGVGKSFRMLDEGRRRKLRGQDVVIAATQTVAPADVRELMDCFEVIPPIAGLDGPAIDVAAVLRRHPQMVLIDGLAHQNPPGSKNAERWQDVEQLLAAGICVITSVNLQYIKEKQKRVEAIRGKSVKDSVPEAFVRTADEIELVDAAPEHCVSHSLENGSNSVLDASQMERQLSELREIALVLAADVVDHQLEEYLHGKGIQQLYGTHERILVCVTPRSNADLMIRRGRRQADRFHGELYVVYVQQDDLNPQDQAVLDANLAVAREASAHVETLHAEDAIAAILQFALEHGITQIFVGHSQRSGLLGRWKANPVERLIMEADGIDIRIFPHAA
ncbi:MAG TPA: universal stress protein [Bryobacteraceae bacterium]|nr:universal stress protein [Bryobacteraceae bacterium]